MLVWCWLEGVMQRCTDLDGEGSVGMQGEQLSGWQNGLALQLRQSIACWASRARGRIHYSVLESR